ncbi:MAG: hypothetical protein HYU66_24560 [Armatimonadetes bacterium]|nr:hypothetical protein [Armatimonadota bacterium]
MMTDERYQSDIPAEAEERVVVAEQVVHASDDGMAQAVTLRRSAYYLGGEEVGWRTFHETGEIGEEMPLRNGRPHGRNYQWYEPGCLTFVEPYEDGLPHGTAVQYNDQGQVIGTYTMDHGTGWDLWYQHDCDGMVRLTEAHCLLQGDTHGFEWWFHYGSADLWEERQWHHGQLHGIEREWNYEGRLRRGYPNYWVHDQEVTKRQYLRAAAKDPTLPPFRSEDNLPQRELPPEVAEHLTPWRLPIEPAPPHDPCTGCQDSVQ